MHLRGSVCHISTCNQVPTTIKSEGIITINTTTFETMMHHPTRTGPAKRLLLLWLVAIVVIFAPPAAAFLQPVTPDNSVLLANALGYRHNYGSELVESVCLIKIHSVRAEDVGDGTLYTYDIYGCKGMGVQGFGMCKTIGCDVRNFRVRIFAPKGAKTGIVNQVEEF